MIPDGMVTIASVDGYAATVDRLDHALQKHGVATMLRWDHAAAAARVGIQLRPLLLILFGDPRIGTPLMQASPTTGIDLPLKLLVWEAEDGNVWVGYNDPAWIGARHAPAAVSDATKQMGTAIHGLAVAAAGMSPK